MQKYLDEHINPRQRDDFDTGIKLTRIKLLIDNELKVITNSTTPTITTMDSTTPTMGIGVEYETTTTASSGDRYVYRIQNVDFGIVERARQDLTLNKRVKTMKVTLANGTVLTNFEVKEDGTLEGQTSSITYIPPSENSSPPSFCS